MPTMPTDLRRHVRYPEALLNLQSEVYGLYHLTNPEVFFNREDLWTLATETNTASRRFRRCFRTSSDEAARRNGGGVR